MSDAEALRRAIERHGAAEGDMWHPCAVVQDAARRWLALAEGDEAVMSRLADALGTLEQARWALAAITEEWEPGPS